MADGASLGTKANKEHSLSSWRQATARVPRMPVFLRDKMFFAVVLRAKFDSPIFAKCPNYGKAQTHSWSGNSC